MLSSRPVHERFQDVLNQWLRLHPKKPQNIEFIHLLNIEFTENAWCAAFSPFTLEHDWFAYRDNRSTSDAVCDVSQTF